MSAIRKEKRKQTLSQDNTDVGILKLVLQQCFKSVTILDGNFKILSRKIDNT